MRRINNALLIPYRPADHLEAGRMLVQALKAQVLSFPSKAAPDSAWPTR